MNAHDSAAPDPVQRVRPYDKSFTTCPTKDMPVTGGQVILALKVAVSAVTVLLAASAVALVRGNIRLHGRINMVFFALSMTAVLSLEIIVRFIDPGIFSY